MRSTQITGGAIAAFFAVTTLAFAQTEPVQPQTKTTDTAATQTFTGCLMTEPEYRTAHNLGAGQLGGVGLGDEFVLVDVKVSPAKDTAVTAPASDAAVGATASTNGTATTKCADKGTAYRLVGTDEEKLKDLVGRHIEVQGRFKHAADATAGGTRPGEKLPAEVEFTTFREVPAPAAVTEPAAPTTPVQAAPPPPPPVQTAPPVQTPPPVQTSPPTPVQADVTTTPRSELPQTASSTGLIALVGVLALCSGLALTVMRRRLA